MGFGEFSIRATMPICIHSKLCLPIHHEQIEHSKNCQEKVFEVYTHTIAPSCNYKRTREQITLITSTFHCLTNMNITNTFCIEVHEQTMENWRAAISA